MFSCSPQRFTVKININSSSPGHNVPELEGEVEFYFHDSRCLYLFSAVYFLLLQLRFDDRVILKVMDIRKSDFQDLRFKSSSKSFHLFLYSKFLFLNLWWALLHNFPVTGIVLLCLAKTLRHSNTIIPFP